MVQFNFKARFVAPILAGTKVQTIRKPRKRDARPGDTLQLQSGDRFHPVRLGLARAVLVDKVSLDFRGDRRVLYGHLGMDVAHEAADLDRFAVMDGFTDWSDMRAFWAETHDGVPEFHGVRCFWGDTFRAAAIA